MKSLRQEDSMLRCGIFEISLIFNLYTVLEEKKSRCDESLIESTSCTVTTKRHLSVTDTSILYK